MDKKEKSLIRKKKDAKERSHSYITQG